MGTFVGKKTVKKDSAMSRISTPRDNMKGNATSSLRITDPFRVHMKEEEYSNQIS